MNDNKKIVELNDNTYCIYAHINKTNGKIYVGQTCNIKDRWKNEGSAYKKCKRFYNALKKYKWNGFLHEIWKTDLTLEEANYWECFYIERYKTTDEEHGYNLTSGGSNGKHSEETKALMSEKSKGENNSQYGTHHSPEHNAKIGKSVSESQKGKPKVKGTPAQKAAAEKLRGVPLTEEHKQKDSEGLVKYYMNLSKNEYIEMANSKCDYFLECEQTGRRFGSFVEVIVVLHPEMETTSKAFKRKLRSLQDCNRTNRKKRPFENLTFKRIPKQ